MYIFKKKLSIDPFHRVAYPDKYDAKYTIVDAPPLLHTTLFTYFIYDHGQKKKLFFLVETRRISALQHKKQNSCFVFKIVACTRIVTASSKTFFRVCKPCML